MFTRGIGKAIHPSFGSAARFVKAVDRKAVLIKPLSRRSATCAAVCFARGTLGVTLTREHANGDRPWRTDSTNRTNARVPTMTNGLIYWIAVWGVMAARLWVGLDVHRQRVRTSRRGASRPRSQPCRCLEQCTIGGRSRAKYDAPIGLAVTRVSSSSLRVSARQQGWPPRPQGRLNLPAA